MILPETQWTTEPLQSTKGKFVKCTELSREQYVCVSSQFSLSIFAIILRVMLPEIRLDDRNHCKVGYIIMAYLLMEQNSAVSKTCRLEKH